MAKIPNALPSFCEVVEHLPVFSTAHALQVMADVSEAGGEGIVCRPPSEDHSPVKLKPCMDAEAVIIKANFRTYATIPASYTLERDGQQFKARASGRLIPSGTLVTFYHRGFDPEGTPRFASVKGERLFD